MNEKKWQSLTDQQKGWVMEGVQAGIKYCDETNLKAEAELVEFFKNAGLKVYKADIDAFSKHVLAEYLNSPFSKTWDMSVYKQIQDAAK